jgi:PIN domain nuclease of toxin-antitoxin system
MGSVAVSFLLDTHAIVWLLEGSAKLGRKARAALQNESTESVAISDVSLLEIALLEQRNVITLKPDLATGLKSIAERLSVFQIDAAVAADAVRLALPHRDPFDRVITATARVHGLTLVTKDERITRAKVVPTLW